MMKGFPFFFFTVLYLIHNIGFSFLVSAQDSDKENCDQKTSTPTEVVSPGPFNRDECSEVNLSEEKFSVKFFCDEIEGVTSLIAQVQDNNVTLINHSSIYSDSPLTALQRCQAISFRLQKYYPQGLNYITTGRVNGQNVICLTSSDGGNCQEILFTLRPDQSPDNILESIFDTTRRASSGPISETNARTYINLTEYLQQSAVADTNPPTEVEPSNYSPMNEVSPAIF